ncbi:MAG TPA: AMP-binding protein, partial [Sphingomicrobium sp.]|nr:AMP-binding protein [Sphingomicrobium sp.]
MIGQLLSINAERHAREVAVVFGSRRYTYAALNDRACRLANALSLLGIRPGDRVATLQNNCNHFVDLFFATAKLGAILVPVNFRLTAEEVEFALNNCRPKALFAGYSMRATLTRLAGSNALPRIVRSVPDRAALASAPDDQYEQWLSQHDVREPETAVSLADPHLLVHSSGTTGYPKAAIWTHSTTLNSCSAKIIDFALSASDSTAVFGPLFHVGPLMDLAMPLLLRGGKLVVGESSSFDPGKVLQTAADEMVTIMTIYPTMWRRVIQEVDPSQFD